MCVWGGDAIAQKNTPTSENLMCSTQAKGFGVGVTSVPPPRSPKTAARVGLSVLSGVYEKWFEDGTPVEEALLPHSVVEAV